MAQPHLEPGQVVSLAPLGAALANSRTQALFKSDQLELARLVLPAGKSLPTHQVAGEITVLCLEGEIAFDVGGATRTLRAGDLVHLAGGQPHALRAVSDASALLTICLLPAR